jgi:MFS family permease
VLLVGLLVGAAGLASLPLVPNAAGLMIGMAVLGVSGAALSVASGAVLGDVVGGRGGTVVATYQMAGDAGTAAGPVVAGWLADAHGYGAAFGASAAVLLAPVALVVAAPETAKLPPAPAADVAGASSDHAA